MVEYDGPTLTDLTNYLEGAKSYILSYLDRCDGLILCLLMNWSISKSDQKWVNKIKVNQKHDLSIYTYCRIMSCFPRDTISLPDGFQQLFKIELNAGISPSIPLCPLNSSWRLVHFPELLRLDVACLSTLTDPSCKLLKSMSIQQIKTCIENRPIYDPFFSGKSRFPLEPPLLICSQRAAAHLLNRLKLCPKFEIYELIILVSYACYCAISLSTSSSFQNYKESQNPNQKEKTTVSWLLNVDEYPYFPPIPKKILFDSFFFPRLNELVELLCRIDENITLNSEYSDVEESSESLDLEENNQYLKNQQEIQQAEFKIKFEGEFDQDDFHSCKSLSFSDDDCISFASSYSPIFLTDDDNNDNNKFSNHNTTSVEKRSLLKYTQQEQQKTTDSKHKRARHQEILAFHQDSLRILHNLIRRAQHLSFAGMSRMAHAFTIWSQLPLLTSWEESICIPLLIMRFDGLSSIPSTTNFPGLDSILRQSTGSFTNQCASIWDFPSLSGQRVDFVKKELSQEEVQENHLLKYTRWAFANPSILKDYVGRRGDIKVLRWWLGQSEDDTSLFHFHKNARCFILCHAFLGAVTHGNLEAVIAMDKMFYPVDVIGGLQLGLVFCTKFTNRAILEYCWKSFQKNFDYFCSHMDLRLFLHLPDDYCQINPFAQNEDTVQSCMKGLETAACTDESCTCQAALAPSQIIDSDIDLPPTRIRTFSEVVEVIEFWNIFGSTSPFGDLAPSNPAKHIKDSFFGSLCFLLSVRHTAHILATRKKCIRGLEYLKSILIRRDLQLFWRQNHGVYWVPNTMPPVIVGAESEDTTEAYLKGSAAHTEVWSWWLNDSLWIDFKEETFC